MEEKRKTQKISTEGMAKGFILPNRSVTCRQNGIQRNALAISLVRTHSSQEQGRHAMTLPNGNGIRIESDINGRLDMSRGHTMSPRRKFRSWGSPSKVSDSRFTQRKIKTGFELEYCWFCGKSMDGLIGGNDQRVFELENRLAHSQRDKMKILEDQKRMKERHEEMLLEEQKKRKALEDRLKKETEERNIIIKEQIEQRESTSRQARPLTCYLPVRDKNFDLRQHIESAGHILDSCQHVHVTQNKCSGWLFKRGRKLKTWNRKWFELNREERILSYSKHSNGSKTIKKIYFQTIEEVYVDHLRTVKSPDPQLTFCVKTRERLIYLLAPTAEVMRIWIDAIFTGAEGHTEYC